MLKEGTSERNLRLDSRGRVRMISEGVPFDQITVLTLRIRTDRPKQTV